MRTNKKMIAIIGSTRTVSSNLNLFENQPALAAAIFEISIFDDIDK
jgi:hypothetical protein|tara:strand:- start:614 stop:751 length:138 start_codon:yes stop_codon:yes gene_type:complete